MKSRIAWYRTLMCLLRKWLTGLEASARAPWLSIPSCVGSLPMKVRFVGPLWPFRMANRKCRIHTACFAASAAATYSASVVDIAVIGCLRLLQLIGPPAIMKIYALVDRHLVALPYDESENPTSIPSLPFAPEYVIP